MIAPIGLEPPGQPLNINADTVAGEIARAAGAGSLVFLTDVDGVLDGDGALIEEVDAAGAAALREAGVLDGGMIPKVDAALRAGRARRPWRTWPMAAFRIHWNGSPPGRSPARE